VQPQGLQYLREQLSISKALLFTLLGRRRGFFIPYPYIAGVPAPAPSYPELERLFAAAPIAEFAEEIGRWRETLGNLSGPHAPALNTRMFPALDAVACYAAVRHFKPKRVLEIGCGSSTHVLARALKDAGSGRLTCIDPAPRRDISQLDLTLERRTLAISDADLAGEMEAGDILFIDSSHVMMPGMDVDIQFNRMFPRLKPGVLVHLHDIFLPDDYPDRWERRGYNEQNALIAWILSGFFEVVWPGYYVLSRHRDIAESLLAGVAPLAGAGSIWLRRAKTQDKRSSVIERFGVGKLQDEPSDPGRRSP